MTLGNPLGRSVKTEWEKTRKDQKKLVFRANVIARGDDASSDTDTKLCW